MRVINPPNKTYLVSVCLLTYNHKIYIDKAIESILNQKTDFEFNIIIADDFSTDGTAEIIEKYANRYPQKITALIQDKNIGVISNFTQMLLYPRSKYIAYLEGDDYWINERKLQIQADFLEKNPNITLSSHNSNIFLTNGKSYLFNRVLKYSQAGYESVYSIEDYIEKAFFHSSSIFFRRAALDKFPDWFQDVFGAEYFLVLLLSMQGGIHYINDIFSVYRINSTSISNYFSRQQISGNINLHLQDFDKYSDFKYHKAIEKKRFSSKYSFYYYYPNYFKKCWFAIKNFKNILQLSPNVISKYGRFKIFIPTRFLRSRINLFEKLRS
jgi:glycosyltransferase involved in cell wall biosynthesis